MKRRLFLAVIPMLFVMMACQDVIVEFPDNVGEAVQRPGAPRDVTAEVSPCNNWAIVSWLVGENHTNIHQIHRRQSGMQTMESVTPVSILPFFNPLDRPRIINGPAQPMVNTVTLSWNPDSSLSADVTANRDRVSAVIPLFHERTRVAADFQVGVRTVGAFDQNLATVTHSPTAWANGTRRFRPLIPHGTAGADVVIMHPSLVGTAGTAIDLRERTEVSFAIDERYINSDDYATLTSVSDFLCK